MVAKAPTDLCMGPPGLRAMALHHVGCIFGAGARILVLAQC